MPGWIRGFAAWCTYTSGCIKTGAYFKTGCEVPQPCTDVLTAGLSNADGLLRASEAAVVQRPPSRQTAAAATALQAIKREDGGTFTAPTTRRRDPRSFRKRAHHHPGATHTHMAQEQASREHGEGGWQGLSRSMSEGAAPQTWVTKSPSKQVPVFCCFIVL